MADRTLFCPYGDSCKTMNNKNTLTSSLLVNNSRTVSVKNIDRAHTDHTIKTPSNPLLIATDPVFILFDQIKHQKTITTISDVRAKLSKAINDFKEKLARLGYYHDIILMSTFALCAFIDEAFVKTPWGIKHHWQKQALTHDIDASLHADTYFFDLLEYALSRQKEYIDAIELMHVCLSLGFKGKYKKNAQKKRLALIKKAVYQTIRSERNNYSTQLSNIIEKNLITQHDRASKPISIATVIFITLFLIGFISGEFYYLSYLHNLEIKQQLTHLNLHEGQ